MKINRERSKEIGQIDIQALKSKSPGGRQSRDLEFEFWVYTGFGCGLRNLRNNFRPKQSTNVRIKAIAARVHRRKGLISVTMEAVMRVPATIAAGVAMVSRRSSTQGI